MNKYFILTALSILTLSSCTLGPNTYPVDTCFDDTWPPLPEEIDIPVVLINEEAAIAWWEAFDDPLLNMYICWTAQDNYDIRIAESRVLQARANRLIAQSYYYPDIEFSASGLRTHLSKNGPFNPANFEAGNFINAFDPFQILQNLFTIGFDASWEIDVFGKITRSVQAAEAREESAIEHRNDVLITAYAEVAQNYIQIRGLQKRLELMNKNTLLLERMTELVKKRQKKGMDNNLDVAQIDSQLATVRAEIPPLYSQISASIYSLSILTGHYPEELETQLWSPAPLPTAPIVIPIGIRSDLLRRRPDVRQAERELAAATADIGVAIANAYPSFSLSGIIGLQSQHFHNWFQGRSVYWQESAAVSSPIFRGGRLVANVFLSEANQSQRALEYEKTVLNALEESQTNLVRYINEMNRRMELQTAVHSNQRLLNLAFKRYQNGLIDLKTTLDFERQLLSAEEKLIDSETTSLTNLISLYKSLGGGWETEDSEGCE